MVMLGAVNDQASIVDMEMLLEAFKKVFGASKEKFIPINKEALSKGAIGSSQRFRLESATITGSAFSL